MPSIQFKGKSIVHSHHLTVPYHQLVPHDKKSVLGKGERASLQGNLIVHGDNLTALKALLPSFAGKVKCIYIDPPYNTGNEGWAYNDNVNHPMLQEWLGKTVDKEDLTRHDKWLCMMTPRLKLLQELLRDDGVIFISIDDNEVHHLRQLMDEIFGEENFVANIVWQKKQSPQNDATYFSDMHDHILVYAKHSKEDKNDTEGWTRQLLVRTVDQEARFANPDNDPRGSWISVDYTSNKTSEERPNLYYAVVNPNSKKKLLPSRDRVWAFESSMFQEHLGDKRIWWGSDGMGYPRLKKFRTEVQEGIVPSTWWTRDEAGDNQESKREIRAIFADSADDAFDFATPKPTRLIARIIQVASNSPDDIILDSFAGSGTTAHAVLALNAEDGGNRRFVLIEQEDYADTITAERVRRVINGVKGAKDVGLKKGLGGTFSYFTLGESFEAETLLRGGLPAYLDLARFVFFTATGEQLDESKVNEGKWTLGESKRYSVYLIYKQDMAFLKTSESALTLPFVVEQLPVWKQGDKPRLVIASHKYLDEDRMAEFRIEFCQLPWGIYKYRA